MTEGFTSAHESPISLRFRYWCRYRSEQWRKNHYLLDLRFRKWIQDSM
jgi:hypothetical protein